MGFLDEIGSGLRSGLLAGAAGMSNEVFREQGQAIARRKEHDQDRQSKAAEIMLQAAHSGQIPDEHLPELQQSLKRMGYDLPIEALRATPDAREKLGEYARNKTARERKSAGETSMANLYDQPQSGLGMPGAQGLQSGAPTPLQQIPMPPRPQGMAPDQSANPPGVQTFPLAPPDRQMGTPSPEQPFSQDQQDRIADTEATSDNPDYPPQMMPPAPRVAVEVRPGETPQLASVQTDGLRPKDVSRGTIPPIVQNSQTSRAPSSEPMVPGPIPNGGLVPFRLASKWKQIVEAKNAGVEVADPLFKQLLAEMYPTKSGLITVGKDQTLFDPRTGKAVFHGEPEELKAVQEFNAMLDQSGITDPAARQKMWADYTSRKGAGASTSISFGGLTAGIGPDGNPVFAQSSNKGGAQIVEGFTPAPKEGKPLTESQAKATSFGMRAQASHDIATQIEESSNEVGTLKQAAKDAVPGGNYITSSDMQRYNQAKKEFINAAVLRQDSGAAINAGEYVKYNNIYFPQPGDSKETVAQKAASRETAVQGLAVGAGESGKKAQLRVQGATIQRPARGSMGTAAGFAPPKGAPAGTKFHGYSPDGQRVWKLPDGSMATE